MTYSLRTLNSASGSSETDAQAELSQNTGLRRFTEEILLFLGAAGLLFLVLAMFSFSAKDPSWSGSGLSLWVANWMGLVGAWLADILYFCFGFSAWWLVAVMGRVWLNAWANWLRGAGESSAAMSAEDPSSWQTRTLFWLGLLLLMSASAAVEWSRLSRWDVVLPGPSGGALGYAIGQLAVKGLGANGASLLGIFGMAMGMSWAFGFSWGQVCESLGSKIDGLMQSRQEKREMEEDLALGQQALREREQLQS
jgi:S-DNA-T family DNA segregation ATPase FtsK/SpoIIIE